MVNESAVAAGDLAIRSCRIEHIGGAIGGEREIDAGGAWLLRGMIDDQVHFRGPGFEHKRRHRHRIPGDAGWRHHQLYGKPNSSPQTITAGDLEDKHRRAAAKPLANCARVTRTFVNGRIGYAGGAVRSEENDAALAFAA